MTKWLLLLSLLLALAVLAGCSQAAEMEAHTWELVRIQDAQSGDVLYCLPEEQASWPAAQALPEEMVCTALDGTLTLTGAETARTGAYAPLENGSGGAGTSLYTVEWSDGESAQAICGVSTENGEEEPVLLLRGEDEVLYFAPADA